MFPAVRLLLGLSSTAQTAARTPWWLLALRLAAAALIVVGLARPVLSSATDLPGRGPLLLVIDDGWASASDWPARLRAAEGVLARAERTGRRVALLTTAPGADPPAVGPEMAAPDLRARLAVLRPKPWPVDRRAAAAAIRAWSAGHHGGTAYIGDGITDGADWDGFAQALGATGPVLALGATVPLTALVLAPTLQADGITVTVAQPARLVATTRFVLAQAADGRTLARIEVPVAAGAATGKGHLTLPPELRNRLARLVLEGVQGPLPGAGGIVLLDEASRRHPVGLLADDANADALLTGSAYYLRRALGPYAELREGDLRTLLARPLSMLVLSDHPLPPGPEADALLAWVGHGGLLLRFAGPLLADAAGSGADTDLAGNEVAADALLPVRLLAQDRQLGGAMSWSKPAALAAFPPDSPFAGLAVPDEIRVQRQVLADPAASPGHAIWARLADGTPLVTQRQIGAGRVVLFHVTANADWSNLPLSGLFVDMLRRLVGLSAGVMAEADPNSDAMLAPGETLDGEGVAGPPPPGAIAIAARQFTATAASFAHPPGLYGPEASQRALNLSTRLPPLRAAPAIAGARLETLAATVPDRPLGPWLLGVALLLLVADLLLSLRLRGLWRPAALAVLLVTLGLGAGPAWAQPSNPALETRLAFVRTGDAAVDDIARAGLGGLSAYVNARTAAVLAEPAAVTPGSDDLSFYPLLYWALSADAPEPGAAEIAALNDYTAHGGIIVIDTRDGGDGGASAPGTAALLRRIGRGGALLVPPLAPLDRLHVLARSFYLLNEFPGRYVGTPVWVGRDQDPSNDSVSPVIVGGNDWAAAWAVDADGRHPYAALPGGERQRTLAYRFGVNLVMYALTGNYKGDQVHVPALLQRFGQ